MFQRSTCVEQCERHRLRIVGANQASQRAQKKAPGKTVSQGGRGQQSFPGAIGRFAQRPLLGPPCRQGSSKRPSASLPTESASWSAEESLVKTLPMQTDPRGRFVVLVATSVRVFVWFVPRNSHPSRNVRRENMEIAPAGQGVFSRNLPANFHATATRIREIVAPVGPIQLPAFVLAKDTRLFRAANHRGRGAHRAVGQPDPTVLDHKLADRQAFEPRVVGDALVDQIQIAIEREHAAEDGA